MRSCNLDECADFLKIHGDSAADLAASGGIPAAKIGRRWVFLEENLVAYLRTEIRVQTNERQERADMEGGREAVALLPRPFIRRKPLPFLPLFPKD